MLIFEGIKVQNKKHLTHANYITNQLNYKIHSHIFTYCLESELEELLMHE